MAKGHRTKAVAVSEHNTMHELWAALSTEMTLTFYLNYTASVCNNCVRHVSKCHIKCVHQSSSLSASKVIYLPYNKAWLIRGLRGYEVNWIFVSVWLDGFENTRVRSSLPFLLKGSRRLALCVLFILLIYDLSNKAVMVLIQSEADISTSSYAEVRKVLCTRG